MFLGNPGTFREGGATTTGTWSITALPGGFPRPL